MHLFAAFYSRYVITGLILAYALAEIPLLAVRGNMARGLYLFQRACWFAFMTVSYLTLFDGKGDPFVLGLWGIECSVMIAAMLLYDYGWGRQGHSLLLNNVIMLFSVGLVMIARIDPAKSLKQFLIGAAALVVFDLLPFGRKILAGMKGFWPVYGLLGTLGLAGVYLLGHMVNGANLNFTIAGFTFQPSELIKILYILFMASCFAGEMRHGELYIAAFLSLLQVGILVLSRDLGTAMIFFMIFVMMVLAATRKFRYAFLLLLAGAGGAFACWMVFPHIRSRFAVFLDPWSDINGMGYQITQALFGISYGGLFGAGLGQGMPTTIPFVESDFMFAAICEEMGIIAGCGLLLICLFTFLDMIFLSERIESLFLSYFVFGSAVCFIFQTFTTVGGEVGFIPLTGVTMPLVSYGGSSILSTIIMFGMVSSAYILDSVRREEREGARVPAGPAGPLPGREPYRDSGTEEMSLDDIEDGYWSHA